MKIITVPKNKDAMEKLDYDNASPDDLFEVKLSNDEFIKLWNAGVFATINNKCGTMISEYEDDQITDIEDLENLIATLELQEYDEIEYLVQKIIDSLKKAVLFGTGIFFFF